MKIFIGKSKKKVHEISLKELIAHFWKEQNPKIEFKADRFSDNSSSWIDIRKECIINGKEYLISDQIGFNPENDNEIIEIESWISEKLEGYDEDHQKRIV